ncbi:MULTISPECIES: cytochrome b [Marinomonas]|uniref:Cytochrome b/b6 domain-containing protein n=1 Tax=Marinomonas rhodophyticola TaxID=2992803 RepID=A0ABT3KBR4_9GAMM|nr:cytochrome b/b6 domain-containing protein [Marinomonas sp. KJ51-3]MCW4627980.1 cytochrome b/b6 domain-containing protein [Marinomonas sp. KJ51-3]
MHTTKRSYNTAQILLHWAIAALIVFNYFVSDGMGRAFRQHLNDSNSGYNLVASLHVYVGLAIIALVVVRIIVRFMSKKTKTASTNVFDRVSLIVHEILYLLMFLVPVFGTVAWYLGIHIMGDVHEIAMNIMMALVLLHAAAALFHQYVLKDGTLMKMFGQK